MTPEERRERRLREERRRRRALHNLLATICQFLLIAIVLLAAMWAILGISTLVRKKSVNEQAQALQSAEAKVVEYESQNAVLAECIQEIKEAIKDVEANDTIDEEEQRRQLQTLNQELVQYEEELSELEQIIETLEAQLGGQSSEEITTPE